jgi:hypothetical protein
MRRVTMLLGTAGMIALGLAATPAQAQNGWWGYRTGPEQTWRENQWREYQWRDHHYWRPWYYHHSYYIPRMPPGYFR